MIQTISFSRLITLVSSLFLMFLPYVSYGETYVYSSDVSSGATWTREGSPYLLQEPIYIPQDVSLQIDSGVVVMSASTTDDMEPYSISANGNIHVYGTKEAPVRFVDLKAIYMSYNMSDIHFASFEKTGIDLWRSTSTLDNIHISRAEKGISARGSSVDVFNSVFDDNHLALYSGEYIQGPFMSRGNTQYGVGGIGNALDVSMIMDSLQNSIRISSSSLEGQEIQTIINETVNTIDARDNWWGSNDGPKENSIQGAVVVSPWKVKQEDTLCCSSILFLPGIEASRLYLDTHRFFSTSTNTLWEPNRAKDIDKLFLDDNGMGITQGVYTKDIIDSALGVKPIYKKFIEKMDSLVTQGSVNNWLPYPYDWRKDVSGIVTEDLIDKVYSLASSSKTHKVTIVAHSNGGLVAKALVKELEHRGTNHVVDQVILIAVPELGTPQALPALLHGYGQTLLGGFLMGKNTARMFSQNMPGAYGLLPSEKFFEQVNKPVIIADGMRDAITYEDMKKFLTQNEWSATSSKDTNVPLLLKQTLLSLAHSVHESIDTWVPEESVKISSIMGWGLPTTQAIKYHKDIHCTSPLLNRCSQEPQVILSTKGDGTVLSDSSTDLISSKIFFNMRLFKNDGNEKVEHADILESDAVLDVVEHKVANVLDAVSPQYKKYFSTEEPTSDDVLVTVQIFSPVDIHVYDKKGRHTGRASNPIPGNELDYVEDNVPGITYVYGDQRIEQIAYNLNDGPYRIVLDGQAPGLFSALVEFHQNDQVIASTTFNDMPVTSLMTADFVISTSTENIASGTVMFIDADGDGFVDITSRSRESLNTDMNSISDLGAYLEYMRKTILALKLPKLQERALLFRIDRISGAKVKKYERLTNVMGKKIELRDLRKNKLSEAEGKTIANLFEGLLAYIEQGGWENDPRNKGI